jgi:hypothetical protein
MILMGLQLVMSHSFVIIMNGAKCLQRREKKGHLLFGLSWGFKKL